MSNEIPTTNQDSSPEEEVKELSKEEKIEVYREWIEALRSGKYMQTREALKRRENETECSYCCLGVLCEIGKEIFEISEYPPNLTITEDEDGYPIAPPDTYYFEDTEESLPEKVCRKLGWRNGNGFNYIGERMGRKALAILNDEGMSFSEISDIIEKEYLKPLLETKDE